MFLTFCKWSALLPPVLCLLMVLTLFNACTNTTAPQASTAPTPYATMETNGSRVASAVLQHTPMGTAQLAWDEKTQVLIVTMDLKGLATASTHPIDIRAESCINTGGIVYSLQNIVTDEHGAARGTSMVKGVSGGIPTTGWFLTVHNGPQLSSDDQLLPLACGTITNPNASALANQNAQVTFAATPGANQAASGAAQLTLNHDTLTVVLTVNGLLPASTHAAHIYAGSCEDQGKSLYGLKAVTADNTGNGTSSTTLEHVSALPARGWSVIVHLATDTSTQTGNDPIACGNVVSGALG